MATSNGADLARTGGSFLLFVCESTLSICQVERNAVKLRTIAQRVVYQRSVCALALGVWIYKFSFPYFSLCPSALSLLMSLPSTLPRLVRLKYSMMTLKDACVFAREGAGERRMATLSPAKTAGNLISARVHSGPSAGDRGAQSLLIWQTGG